MNDRHQSFTAHHFPAIYSFPSPIGKHLHRSSSLCQLDTLGPSPPSPGRFLMESEQSGDCPLPDPHSAHRAELRKITHVDMDAFFAVVEKA